MSIHVIMVPTDLTPASDPAITFAAELARKQGARVLLFHAVESSPPVASLSAVEEGREMERREHHARQQLDLQRAGLPPGSEFEVIRGPAASSILECAARHKAEMIVMCTHGRRGIARWVMGSVAEYVVRRAACPVTCVPQSAVEAAAPA